MATTPNSGYAVNNGRRQPITGQDVIIYFQDQSTGLVIPLGEFMEFQFVERNDTMAYLPIGSRNYNFLDGAEQFVWQARQGKINSAGWALTNGYNPATGEAYISGPTERRGKKPRFQIIVEINAPELQAAETVNTKRRDATLTSDLIRSLSAQNSRAVNGRYILAYAKIDTKGTTISPGKEMVMDTFEGFAESIIWQPNDGTKGLKSVFERQSLNNPTLATAFANGPSPVSNLTGATVPSWV